MQQNNEKLHQTLYVTILTCDAGTLHLIANPHNCFFLPLQQWKKRRRLKRQNEHAVNRLKSIHFDYNQFIKPVYEYVYVRFAQCAFEFGHYFF